VYWIILFEKLNKIVVKFVTAHLSLQKQTIADMI
jgi:hypothetical protein